VERLITLIGLKQMLGAQFRLIEGRREVLLVIRETRRKHQHTLSELTISEKQ
jgi:hypothetical protein